MHAIDTAFQILGGRLHPQPAADAGPPGPAGAGEVETRRFLGMARRDDAWMQLHGNRLGLCQRSGQVGQGRRRLQVAWRHTDHGAERLARDLQLAAEARQRRLRGGQSRLGQADIRPRHLAQFETVAGRAHLFAQHLDVVLANVDRDLVAADIHVGLHRTEQHLLLDIAQQRAVGHDLRPGRLDRRRGLAVIVKKQRGAQLGRYLFLEAPAGRTRGRGVLGPEVGSRRADGCAHIGALRGSCDRHVLVDAAQRGPLGFEKRAGLVRPDQGVSEGVGRGGCRHRPRQYPQREAPQQSFR